MTAKETERLARLEEKVINLVESNLKQTQAIESIQKTLDELTGGKRALIRLTTWTIAIAGIAVALYNALKDR